MKTTKIEWTDSTWNPVTGCSKISEGCVNCYAETMSKRLHAMGQKKYKNGFKLTLHKEVLDEPLNWKKSHTIFVCSMSDLFHVEVPFSFIDKVIEVIHATPQHCYQILTKRSDRMKAYFQDREIPLNVWLGVTVESKNYKKRIDDIRRLKASVKFISCEPLLEDLGKLNLKNIDWVIVGGESGNRARPMKEEWVENIQTQATNNDVAFFFKQWGGVNKNVLGRKLEGREWNQMPRVRSSYSKYKLF